MTSVSGMCTSSNSHARKRRGSVRVRLYRSRKLARRIRFLNRKPGDGLELASVEKAEVLLTQRADCVAAYVLRDNRDRDQIHTEKY